MRERERERVRERMRERWMSEVWEMLENVKVRERERELREVRGERVTVNTCIQSLSKLPEITRK